MHILKRKSPLCPTPSILPSIMHLWPSLMPWRQEMPYPLFFWRHLWKSSFRCTVPLEKSKSSRNSYLRKFLRTFVTFRDRSYSPAKTCPSTATGWTQACPRSSSPCPPENKKIIRKFTEWGMKWSVAKFDESSSWRLLFGDFLRLTFRVTFLNYLSLQNLIFLNFGKKFF